MAQEITEFELAGVTVLLETRGDTFKPVSTTKVLADHMGDVRGKTVLDLGCGTGPIAIAAALLGATQVTACDVMQSAVDLTAANARLNKVDDRVETIQGSLFEPVKGRKFDAILCDVSGVAEEVARATPWYPDSIPSGGPDGADPTVEVVEKAPDHLNAGGYLIFPVLSLANVERMMEAATKTYGEDGLSKLDEKNYPFPPELSSQPELIDKMAEEKKISYTRRGSRYLWSLTIYRAEVK